uniref:ATP synthase F0 subunit 8 n=1 Tax=Pholcus phalangioides TaxID=6932 RepID=L7NW01_PHOPA|nr:ATP synthase F0 subunit 8 [Pholcus phalangioides]AFC77885.1 ATP synthase F0 subunit 8 [Pholcus phalangioides]
MPQISPLVWYYSSFLGIVIVILMIMYTEWEGGLSVVDDMAECGLPSLKW